MKSFDQWIEGLAKPAVKMVRVLTDEAQDERDSYESYCEESGGCRCHINPPCGACTHPGNPVNQDEDDGAWRLIPEDQA